MNLKFNTTIPDFEDYDDSMIPKYDRFENDIDEKSIKALIEWQVVLNPQSHGIVEMLVFQLISFKIEYNWQEKIIEKFADNDYPSEHEYKWVQEIDDIKLDNLHIEFIIENPIETHGIMITNVWYNQLGKTIIIYIN